MLITERFIDKTADKHLVCMANDEIFIAEGPHDNPSSSNLSVIRYVTADRLEELQSDYEIREYYRDLWKMAVQADKTEDSLDGYIEDVRGEEPDDEEYYPGKDPSFCDIFDCDHTEGAREFVDDYIHGDNGDYVGTWEGSGSYTPRPDSRIQIVFDPELMERYCPWFNMDEIDDVVYE